jgi:hypothetical protein
LRHVCFIPKSRHSLPRPACPLCARSGHSANAAKRCLFDQLVGCGKHGGRNANTYFPCSF